MSSRKIQIYSQTILKSRKCDFRHLHEEPREKTPAPRKVYFNIKANILHTPARMFMTADSQ